MKRKLLLAALFFLSSSIYAQGVAHLTFHMAAGAEDNYKIGATIENKGGAEIYGGYIVFIPVDEKCVPLQPVLKTYGTLTPGEKKSIESNINIKISGYRVSGFYAYDEYGYGVKTIDETKDLIESRKDEEVKNCSTVNDRKKFKIVK